MYRENMTRKIFAITNGIFSLKCLMLVPATNSCIIHETEEKDAIFRYCFSGCLSVENILDSEINKTCGIKQKYARYRIYLKHRF